MYKDLLESPDKNDPSEYLLETSLESKYSSIRKSGKFFKDAAKQKGFSLLRCNTHSLGKNVSLLHDILLTLETRAHVIAISETKINENSYANINLPGYNFVNTNSKSQAGGVSVYLANKLEFSRKTDLDISHNGIESCWVELACHKQKNIVIGCIYQHPKSDRSLFYETLKKQLESLNSKGKEVLILGDVNIDFLKYNKDVQTSEYLDMLFDLGFMPVITKATRVTDHTSSLIDDIYTNAPEKVIKSGICLADISDHLPVFCTIANTLPTSNKARYFRDFTHFNQNAFLLDLSSIDFRTLVNADVNESMSNILNNLRIVTDRHAPVRKASRQKKKQLEKPWVSKAILASIKRIHKLFKTYFWSTDPHKQQEYKTYSNKLSKIIKAARKCYLAKQFELNRNNIKSTWKLIRSLIDRRKK